MAIKWLTTTAVALMIGTGAVIAQSQSDMQQKREEGTRAQTPSKDAERPAAGEQRSGDHMKGRAEQTEPRAGTKELQRGETASPGERKQAQSLANLLSIFTGSFYFKAEHAASAPHLFYRKSSLRMPLQERIIHRPYL